MADHSKPTLTSNYTAFVDEIKGRLEDISKGFDPAKTSPTNVPVDTIRWAGSSNKWQRWNGSAWVDLASTYAVNVATASRLQTGRTIALSGGATGSASFDGSANISINVTALNPSQLSSPVPVDKGGTGAASVAQARTNLGLGTAATRDVTTGDADTTSGRLLKVGDFGLGSRGTSMPILPSGEMPESQFIAGSGEASEGWFNGYGAAIAARRNSTHGFIIENSTNSMAFRIMHQGAWSPWREIYHSGNLPDIDWNSLTGKPSTFPPSSHTHPWSQITGAPATATRWPTTGEVTGSWPWSRVTGAPAFLTGVPTGHGGVGTYAMVTRRGTTPASTTWGQTIAGSNLDRAAIIISPPSAPQSGPLSGTWRIMGHAVNIGTVTLAVRIS